MHYVHKLTPPQKKLLIWMFVLVPILLLSAMFAVWAQKERIFADYFYLKTIVSSADGIERSANVYFSGIKVGMITDIKLNEDDNIELTMKIEEAYHPRIHKDASMAMGALAVFGKKEFSIIGGSKNQPIIESGSTIPLESSQLEVDTLMDRISPLINSAEKAFIKLTEIVNSFPHKKLNASINDLSSIITAIKKGDSSAGMFLSSDKAELYKRLQEIVERANRISMEVEKAAEHIPATVESTKELFGNIAEISGRVNATSKELDINKMQKLLLTLLENMNKTMKMLSNIGPTIEKTVETVGETAKEIKAVAPQIPMILEDVELLLSETLMIIQSMKTAWPVKNLVPAEEQHPLLGSPGRASPYNSGNGR